MPADNTPVDRDLKPDNILEPEPAHLTRPRLEPPETRVEKRREPCAPVRELDV